MIDKEIVNQKYSQIHPFDENDPSSSAKTPKVEINKNAEHQENEVISYNILD